MNQLPIFNRQDVVDLVKSFAGSGDLRLRANGIQALAVLVDGNEPQLAAMAEPEMIDAIATAPSTADGEMMNRFRDRVLAALQDLEPERRRRVLDSLRERHEATRDRVRRNS